MFGKTPQRRWEFFGRYIEVTPHSRIVWTNDEGGEGGAVTTVTFEEKGGQTLLVIHDPLSLEEPPTRAPGAWTGCPRRSSNSTSSSSVWARPWHGRQGRRSHHRPAAVAIRRGREPCFTSLPCVGARRPRAEV